MTNLRVGHFLLYKRSGNVVQKKLPMINSAHGSDTRNIINEIIKAINDRGLEILSESGFLTWLEKNGIKHREEVATFADLPSSDSLNTVRGVMSDNKIYIKKENGWVPFQSIDISKINRVENMVETIAVSVSQFGAVGDNITDDTEAIQAAINNVGVRGGGTVIFPYGKKFRTTGTIKVEHDNVKLSGTGAIIEYDKLTGTALKLGKDSGNTRRLGYLDLQILKKNKSWDNDSVGIEATSLVWSNLTNVEVEGFKTNLLLNSVRGGNSYNQFTLRRLFDGQFNLSIDPKGASGWVNENSFYGGNLSVSSSRTAEERAKAINVYVSAGEGPVVNNNRFYSICLEGDDVKAIEAHGLFTAFYSPRLEGSVIVDLIGEGSVIFGGRGVRRGNVTLRRGCQCFASDGAVVNGSTFTDEDGAFEAKNSSSSTRPVYIARSPSNENVAQVDGYGNIKARSIEAISDTSKLGKLETSEIKIAKNRIDFNNNRAIIFSPLKPTEDLTPGTLWINSTGAMGQTLWIKEAWGVDGWKAVSTGVTSSNTNTRPTVTVVGYNHFDTSLQKPIWWTGTKWVDSSGATV